MLEQIRLQSQQAAEELVEKAKLEKGNIVVIGCSSSEVGGNKIGTGSSLEVARAVFDGLYPVFKEKGIYVATQCCEHLNRAIIIEKELADKLGIDQVNVIPQPKAGGSFSTTAWREFDHPVAVEKIKADAGMDIGDTLIGMHIKEVVVPLRLDVKQIGQAHLVCARRRAKYVGGSRAVYNPELL